jgi:branched-subunit amino acid transport protein
MKWLDFWIVLGITAVCVALCRIAPLFALTRKKLPEKAQDMLRLIPAACFAALVANDLFTPATWSGGLRMIVMPLLASIPVVLVSLYKKSLILSVVTGVTCFALLYFLA